MASSNTNLTLGLGFSAISSMGDSPEKEANNTNQLSLNLNLSIGEQSDNNRLMAESEVKDENDNADGSIVKKKLTLSKEQLLVLEENFNKHSTLNTEEKNDLASQLNLLPRQIEVWFQNRRARSKVKKIEADCKRWKKAFEKLAEENQRLKEENEGLRAYKNKRIKLGSSSSVDAGNGAICPNCRRGADDHGNNPSV